MSSTVTFNDKKVKKFFKKTLKQLDDVLAYKSNYIVTLGAIIYADVIDHFSTEKDNTGARWQVWSEKYSTRMYNRNKHGNKILQDSGALRQGFRPGNWRRENEGVVFYNNAKTESGFPYAYAHNKGGKQLPQRKFMWLSKKARANIRKVTLAYVMGDMK